MIALALTRYVMVFLTVKTIVMKKTVKTAPAYIKGGNVKKILQNAFLQDGYVMDIKIVLWVLMNKIVFLVQNLSQSDVPTQVQNALRKVTCVLAVLTVCTVE